jgi:hypothetical protein
MIIAIPAARRGRFDTHPYAVRDLANEFRTLEEAVIDHTGTHRHPAAHARADPTRLNSSGELARVSVPTLIAAGGGC